MARREVYARIEPKYLTICNMTVKNGVIIFLSLEIVLTAAACTCCFWFGYFNVGTVCVALLVWLILILFGTIIGFQWALVPFAVVHCIAVLALMMALFGLISLTVCPYLLEKWIDYLEDLTIDNLQWYSRGQLFNYTRISFGVCAGVFVLLISLMVTFIRMGYMTYHFLGNYIDKDSPKFEKHLDKAVIDAYDGRKSEVSRSEDRVMSSRYEEPSYMPSEAMLASVASESTVDMSTPTLRVFTDTSAKSISK